MSFNLDWKNFKKTGVDNGIATLRHQRGHEIRISLKSLPPGTRKLLEDLPTHMADGGKVADTSDDTADQIAADAKAQPTPVQSEQPQAPSAPDYAALYEQTLKNTQGSNPRTHAPGFNAEEAALDTVERQKALDQMAATNAANQQQAAAAHAAEINARRQAIGLPPNEGSAVAAPQGAQAPMAGAPTQGGGSGLQGPANPPQVTPGAPGGMDNYMGAMQRGYQLQSKSIDEQKLADQQHGQARAGIFSQQAIQAKLTLDYMQAVQDDAAKERANFVKDIENNYIKPTRVFENMGTGQKVLSAIGLMISGGGAAATHQVQSTAEKFLQGQIDRDMQAQEKNQNTRESLLRNNLEFYKNKMDALNMTRMQINDYYAHLIDEAQAKNVTPQAQAIADAAKGKLMQNNAALQAQMGIRPNGVSMDEYLNTMRVLNPARAKEIQERYIPGVGVASIPVSEDARKRIESHQQLDRQIADMQQFAKSNTGTVNPAVISQGKAKALALQAAAREAILNTVYREGEQPLLDKIISSDPTSIFNKISTLPKLNELRSNNQMKFNTLKQSYGLQPQAAPSGQPQGGGISFTPKK